MTSLTDLRILNKYVLKYSFLFPLVQEVLKFVKKHGSYRLAQNILANFYGPQRTYNVIQHIIPHKSKS